MEREGNNNFESFHSILKQNNPIDPDNIIKYNNTTAHQPNSNSRYDRQTFAPKENLYYCYFNERNPGNKKFISYIKNAIDIQQLCYYPKTTNAYTFIGFSNQEQRDQATRNQKLINYSNNKIIYKFVRNIQEILNFYQKKSKSNQQSNTEKETDTRNTKDFLPREKLIYFYFREPNKTDAERLRDLKHPIYHIFNASDVQLYRYYPGTRKLYSFFGFLNKDEGIRSFRSSKIVLQNYRIKIISNSKLNRNQPKIDFKLFNPTKNIFYCFFVEVQQPLIKYINIKYDRLFGIDDACDIQRFCYHPKTRKISTFLGFTDKNKLTRAIQQSSLRSAAINQEIYLYSIENKNEEKKVSNFGIAGNKDINTNFNIHENDDKNMIHNQILVSKEKNVLFKPNYDLFYLYFKEKDFDNDKQFLDVDDIKDIQRNCRINRKNPNQFTFLGFIQSIQRIYAVKALQKKTNQIDINSITIFDEDYFDDYEYEEEKSENENETNPKPIKNDESEINSQFCYTPKQNLSNDDPDKSIANDQFHYTPVQTQSNIKLNESKDNLQHPNSLSNYTNSTKTRSKFVYSPESDSSIHQQKNISLPIFNNYNTGFRFKSFIPKENLFYCFLAEVNKPSYRSAFDNYTQLFGIQNASDIQRFCYYPGTENVYSFIGFTDQSKLSLSIQKSSFRSAAIGCNIYIYPYKSLLQKTQDIYLQNLNLSNQSDTSTSINNNKKPEKTSINRFVYNPEPNSSPSHKTEKLERKNSNENENISNNNNENENKNVIKNSNDNDNKDNDKINKDNDNDNNNDINNNENKKESNNVINDKFSDENENEDEELFFKPNDELFYLYFRENEPKIINYRNNDTKLFNVNHIKDLQRGFRVSQTDPNYYTFFGFLKCIDLSNAFKILQEQNKDIEISSLQIIDDDNNENDIDDDDDDDIDDDDDDDDYDENDWENGDEDLDFDFDDVETNSDDVIQFVHRNGNISPEEKIQFSNK